MRSKDSLLPAVALIVALTSCRVHAGVIITGNHALVANQANQVISIFANPSVAGEIAVGLNLNFVVDDGGSIVGGIDNNAPKITSINLKPAGGLFASLPDAQTNVFSSQKLFQVTIAPANVANRPVITTNVLLAQVTLDTTGLNMGTWILDLDGIPGANPPLPSSDFAGAGTMVNNGSVTITAVPEPSSIFALSVFLSVATATRLRRNAKKP